MREIKFRAWDIEQKRMVNFGNNDFHYLATSGNRLRVVGCHNAGGDPDTEIDDFNLMQYTGLKDKNGKEIYEGDILRYDNGGEFEEHNLKNGDIALVEYKVSRFTAKVDLWLYGTDGTGKVIYGEVIGNIYENPELLSS